jgi:L-ascorbate metabolism protein UlaG (beta-lactamase superfamily)
VARTIDFSFGAVKSLRGGASESIIIGEVKRLGLESIKKRSHAAMSEGGAHRVSIRPKDGWHKRNFLTEVLIPSLFVRRTGRHRPAVFPTCATNEVCLTWIGHASFLVQMAGMNILIDPNWAKWLKVIKRIKRPGMHLHELPAIDLVLVTHAHFDHLDRRTLREVARDQPIVVPFEVGNLVHDLGFREVREMRYWGSIEIGPLKITMTPAAHWGARFLHDSHRGFGGFVIEAGGRSVFHCGDTAYFPGFAEIGSKLPVEIALLPIGAYEPPTGREVHMNPEEAARAFVELGAKTLVPMHYGTFRLGFEPLGEPPRRLMAAAREMGIDRRVRVMDEGEPIVL